MNDKTLIANQNPLTLKHLKQQMKTAVRTNKMLLFLNIESNRVVVMTIIHVVNVPYTYDWEVVTNVFSIL